MQSASRFFVLVMGLLLAQAVFAAEPKPSALSDPNAFIEAEMAKEKTPGLAIAVVKDGRVIYQRGFGYRDVEHQLPVTANTAFPIASVTKSFTVLSLGSLVEAGKLDWDQPVRSYLPDFQLYDPTATEHMTARDLVSHRSGLPALGRSGSGAEVTARIAIGRAAIAGMLRRRFAVGRLVVPGLGGQWPHPGRRLSGKSDPALRAIALAAISCHQKGNRHT